MMVVVVGFVTLKWFYCCECVRVVVEIENFSSSCCYYIVVPSSTSITIARFLLMNNSLSFFFLLFDISFGNSFMIIVQSRTQN